MRSQSPEAARPARVKSAARPALSALCLFLLAAVRADGQPAPGENRPPRPPVDVALDANDDGIIDASEIANATAALKKLDTNGDGKLTADELRPKGQGRQEPSKASPAPPDTPRAPDGSARPQRKPLPPIVSALDANSDGTIDASELAAAQKALLKLDKNKDGRLSPDEYRPPRPEGTGQTPPATPKQKGLP